PTSRHNPGYNILSVDAITSIIRVRAEHCNRDGAAVPNGSCTACLSLGPYIEVVRDWAKQSPGQMAHARLSHGQLAEKLASVRKQLKKEQNTVRSRDTIHSIIYLIITRRADVTKSLTRARKKIGSHKRFFDLVSTNNDIPGLSRLLANASKEGWGIEKVIRMAILTLQGAYHPRNYTEFEKDLAILIYEL
ncbi:hypothetical protein B0H14DRAFT_2184863, partial [Mycena olivaceomarginata]